MPFHPRGAAIGCEYREMTHNPADPFDLRTAEKPILETFDLAVEGERPVEHAHRVERLLKGARGVTEVRAHVDEERVRITYDSRLTDSAALHELLLEKGYRASVSAD